MPFPYGRDCRIAQFYDYWNELRELGGIPLQRVFDPIEIGPLLRHTWLARWEVDQQDFVYRLAGEGVLAATGKALRHRSLKEIYGTDIADDLRERFQKVCATPLIFHSHGPVYVHLERYGTGERLILPLRDDHGRNTVVIGCTIYAAATAVDTSVPGGLDPEREVKTYLSLDAEPLGEKVREAC